MRRHVFNLRENEAAGDIPAKATVPCDELAGECSEGSPRISLSAPRLAYFYLREICENTG
jgi:hypothetical protein